MTLKELKAYIEQVIATTGDDTEILCYGKEMEITGAFDDDGKYYLEVRDEND